MQEFNLEWDGNDIPGAISLAFHYLEMRDEIVGFIYASPKTLKKIILGAPNEVIFDYIPDGIGLIRTAYLKRKAMQDDVLLVMNMERNIELRLILK